jgi:hypothetical protein
VLRVEKIGFTGTQKGMTYEQYHTLSTLVGAMKVPAEWHHGDCVGADAEFHQLIKDWIDLSGVPHRLIVHPPSDDRKRAYVFGADETRKPKPYLQRNRDIVDEAVDALFGTPSTEREVQRSGTWATMRYARKLERRLFRIMPDGTLDLEWCP